MVPLPVRLEERLKRSRIRTARPLLQEAVLVVLPSLSQRVKRSRCLGIKAARNRAIGVVSIVVYGTRVNALRTGDVIIVVRPLHITTGDVVP